MPDSPDAKLAVLIDADNVQPGIADDLLAEIAKYGVASVKRAYGDWTSDRLKGWKAALPKHAIRPVQQFANTAGKNATDSAMIIDAMDLLYTSRFDGFCIVSSDSDFTGLASRLREAAVTVYGFGERKTPESLRAACDRFIFLDVLRTPSEPAPDESPSSVGRMPMKELRSDNRLVALIRGGIAAESDDDGWANLSSVRNHIGKQATGTDFDPRNWGYGKLVELVNAIGLFEVRHDAQKVLLRDQKPVSTAKATASGRSAPAKKAAATRKSPAKKS